MTNQNKWGLSAVIWVVLIFNSNGAFCADAIRVGIHESKPLAFTDAEGSAAGIYPEVISEIVRQAGWQLEFVHVSWLDGLEKIKRGELDLLGPIAATEERKKIFKFNQEPVIVDWGQVYLPQDSSINSLLDLQNKKVAYQKGHIMFNSLADLLQRFNVDFEGVPVKDQIEVFKMVADGRVQAGAVNRLFGLLNEKPFQLKRSPIIYAPLELCFAAPIQKDYALLEEMDAQLVKMKNDENSAYPHILNKYLFGIPEPGKHATIRQVILIIGFGSILILIMIVWAISLKITVGKRTKELAKSTAKLQESNLLLNAVMETTTDAIFIKNISGQYILANSATCRAMGKRIDQVLKKTDGQLFPSVSAEIINKTDANVLKGSQTILSEEKLETAYGETWWLANKSPYMDQNGNVIGLIGISRDITDIKKAQIEKENLQNELRQAHKMEAVGTLAGGIAHDFNNLLGIIMGNAELAIDDMPDTHPVKINLIEIKTASMRARDVIRQLLSFSRKTGKGKERVSILSIVKECDKLMRASLPTTIEIKLNISEDTMPIEADPTQIHQVIINLCTNAAQAMENTGGILEIELKNVTRTIEQSKTDKTIRSKNYASLTVKDTGMGIDPKIQERIFEPYFTTKEVGQGTGIGLSVVHGIVQNHDGYIDLKSDPGKGTSVTVFFPVSQQPNVADEPKKQELISGSGTILLVDDEASVVKVGAAMLEKLGYRVTGITDPEEALRIFSMNPKRFDLIITDYTMPKLTGEKLADKIKGIRPGIPIILSTGFSGKRNNKKIQGIDVDSYLEKPFDKKRLSQVVNETLVQASQSV